MRPHVVLILFTHLLGHGYIAGGDSAPSSQAVWTAEASCTPMAFDQLASYFGPGQTIADAGSFTVRARSRDSCVQYRGCSPWLDPATPRMEAGTIHTLPASGRIMLYADSRAAVSMLLTNVEPGAPDNEIRMHFELSPDQTLSQLGEAGSFEVAFLQHPLGGSPPQYEGSELAWRGSMTGSTHFTGRLCADGSFHLVSVLTDGLGLSQYAVSGQLGVSTVRGGVADRE